MVSMRSIWKGSVAFGLVNVPVKVYAATEEKDVRFHQVHAEDGGRIRYKRTCELDGKVVEYADIAKAYESDDGRTVILTDDDFAQLPSSASREIEVSSFVPADQIDPVLYDKSYYLEPNSTSTKAYMLLLRTLEQTDRIAIVELRAAAEDPAGGAAGEGRRAGDPDPALAGRGAGRRIRLAGRVGDDQAGRTEDGLHAGGQLRRRFPAGGLHRRLPGGTAAADRRQAGRRGGIPDARGGGRGRGRRGGRPARRAAAQCRAAQGIRIEFGEVRHCEVQPDQDRRSQSRTARSRQPPRRTRAKSTSSKSAAAKSTTRKSRAKEPAEKATG